jgi:hypothetical protein
MVYLGQGVGDLSVPLAGTTSDTSKRYFPDFGPCPNWLIGVLSDLA